MPSVFVGTSDRGAAGANGYYRHPLSRMCDLSLAQRFRATGGDGIGVTSTIGGERPVS